MTIPRPLVVAETTLLEHRRRLSKDEVSAVGALPLDVLPELIDLAHRVRLAYCGPEVELESLVNAKSGACPEDCTFCSQSSLVSRQVDAEVYPFLGIEEVLGAARVAQETGVSQFCVVAAVRGPADRTFTKVLECVRAIAADTDLDIGCSLGLLTRDQAGALAAAGVHCYNHNLETASTYFPRICTTHLHADRMRTARLVKEAGMDLCCGGILGLGETLEDRVELAFELAALEPAEVPINFLNPRPGTPLADRPLLDGREALQAIALFRLVMPSVWLRLAGGREIVLGELQATGMRAGANALVAGNYLTTVGRNVSEDLAMLASLGMPVAREGSGPAPESVAESTHRPASGQCR